MKKTKPRKPKDMDFKFDYLSHIAPISLSMLPASPKVRNDGYFPALEGNELSQRDCRRLAKWLNAAAAYLESKEKE